MRNPKRTARTASSLMIGVGLVGLHHDLRRFGQDIDRRLARARVHRTHIVRPVASTTRPGSAPIWPTTLRATPGVDAVAPGSHDPAVVDGSATDAFFAFDATTIDELFALGTVEGDLDALGADGIAVSADEATDKGWTHRHDRARDVPERRHHASSSRPIYDGRHRLGGHAVRRPRRVPGQRRRRARLPDLRVAATSPRSKRSPAAMPRPTCSTRTRFIDSVNAEIDTMLGLFYALLALAIVIALLGIANTLALSIFERTRELGLLRAVGMARSQVRSTVRWESIMIAVFGTTLGLGSRDLLRMGDGAGTGRPGHRHAHRAGRQPGRGGGDRRRRRSGRCGACLPAGPPS